MNTKDLKLRLNESDTSESNQEEALNRLLKGLPVNTLTPKHRQKIEDITDKRLIVMKNTVNNKIESVTLL